MYDFSMDSDFWHFMAYAGGTGGSCLIIGSAAGVAVMGLEEISFGWYFKNISWLALAGYTAGALLFWLL
jgi:Na+/H+ antiporter NhaD/arsenite permease-like protein